MDPHFGGHSFSSDDFNFENHVPLPDDPNQSPYFPNNEPAPAPEFGSLAVPPLLSGPDDLNNLPASSIAGLREEMLFPAELDGGSLDASSSLGTKLNAGGESPSSNDDDPSDPVLKYISQILMEENIEDEIWISPQDLALQNTEKSFYDVLGEQYPCSPDQLQDFDVAQFIESPSSNFSNGISGEKSGAGNDVTSSNFNYSIDHNWLHDHGEYDQTIASAIHPLDQVHQSNFGYNSPFANSLSHSSDDASRLVVSSALLENVCSDNDSILQFTRGVKEASKFLPPSSQLFVDSGNEGGAEDTLSGSRGRKNHEREDSGLEGGRATKQSASYVEAEKAELSDMLDKVLLWTEKGEHEHLGSDASAVHTDSSKNFQTTGPVQASNVRRRRGKKSGDISSVDLRALLILCAQAVYSSDLQTANGLLKQIRENSSPSGDGSQRLAHYFANALEARMAGSDSRTQSFNDAIAHKRRSVAEVLQAFKLHLSSCPYKKFSMTYMNHIIWKFSQKASVLHIIDFGVGFGFQWPIFIQKLGEQTVVPPKLRITGIELPQPGFRPAEAIEVTGRRLARYCERFNVPFEYSALPSRNWEDIKIEDLKIKDGEMIAVNCFMRFKDLLDETAKENSPRDGVLNLIRRIKPDIFVHAVASASYNAPFFVTRFRQALFHLSSIYDMLDVTVTDADHKYSEERIIVESEFYGRDIMNLIACEGPERVERPESYKQWQARHVRAGFKQLPLDREMMEELQHTLKANYHKDFVLDEDGDWMLFGWKGRIFYATTCWVPT